MDNRVEFVEIEQPCDMHVHLREGELLRSVVRDSARSFDTILVMPNTRRPILTGKDAEDYRLEITQWTPGLNVVSAIYLTPETTPDLIEAAAKTGVKAVKFYPRGATTNSGHGVRLETLGDPWSALEPVFDTMAQLDLILCLHAEDPDVPLLERETRALKTVTALATRHPRLRIVIEHATTRAAIEVVHGWSNIWTTITAHHLVLTTNDVVGNHHHLCMPVAKSEDDRRALLDASMSGHPRILFGSDSAPHLNATKNRAQGAPFGIYSAPVALPLLVGVFAAYGRTDHLQQFVSDAARELYDIERRPRGTTARRVVYKPWTVPNDQDPHWFWADRRLDYALA